MLRVLQVKIVIEVEQRKKLLAMRNLVSNLLLESYLSPGSSNDIAAELAICCSKSFPDITELSTTVASVLTEDESEDPPPVMDVLLDVLLSLLAKSSSPIRLASEKVSVFNELV
jgi:DNA polymerase phi